jgi:hypothetical protein
MNAMSPDEDDRRELRIQQSSGFYGIKLPFLHAGRTTAANRVMVAIGLAIVAAAIVFNVIRYLHA